MADEPNDQFMRRRLAVVARQWDGAKPSAYRLVAWVLDNAGNAKLTITDGQLSVFVTGRDGRDFIVGKDDYVVKDADNVWSSKPPKNFDKYFEAQSQAIPDQLFLDHGSRA